MRLTLWMKRTYPHCPFARYADDAVVHCRSQKQAEVVMQSIASRLEECGLTMHPEKSKIVYCKDSDRTEAYPNVQFTFLGFTFRPRKAQNKQGRLFTSFLPGASNDAMKRMRQTVRGWRLHRQTPARWPNWHSNTTRRYADGGTTTGHSIGLRCKSSVDIIDQKLEQWARRKYKTLLRHKQRSADWLSKMKEEVPEIVLPLAWHSRVRLDDGSRVRRESHVRFCERLGVKFPGPTRHRDGFAVWSKRLEEGTYAVPFGDSGEERRREITAQELGALLSGIDLQQATRRKRYRRSA